ncbi:MAG: N-6 DNA methylase [Actinomycetota bacterium]|nr:N-6 DNA methylase [Actinomycetota bacterium]
MAADSILIGIPEIADIAKVSRPAVSNWRKRYDDFPEPRVQSDSGVLFDLRAIEEWLLVRGKIDQPIPHGVLVWRVADALRASWPGETLFESTSSMLLEFTSSWLCYLEACARAAADDTLFDRRRGRRVEVPTEHQWSVVRESPDTSLVKRLRAAAKVIESSNPQLVDLLAYLAPDPFPDPRLVRSFVAELEAASDDTTPRFALFEEAQQNVVEVARTSAEWSTPDDLSYLVTELVGKIDSGATVVDPACGTGGLLLMAGVADSAPEDGARFVGTDINQAAAKYARARFFLYGVDAEIESLNSLRRDPSEWPAADVVLCDPPYGLNNWGDADLYRSSRWRYGSAPPNSADLAWVQLALSILKPTGKAAVVLPPGSCFRGGRESTIREAMVGAGVIEAVIHMPPRLRRDTSIPLTIWLLRAKPVKDAARRVLLVDASALGTAGRSTHDLSAEDVEELAGLVRRWRSDGVAEAPGDLMAVAVDADTLIAAGADLTPRRYAPVAASADVDELRKIRREARAEAQRASQEFDRVLAKPADAPSSRESGPHARVRLGEVAEVFRPRGQRDADDEITAHAGDLLLTTTATGFATRLLGQGEPISGLHPVVVRASNALAVTSPWLLLWTRTDEFAGLVDRYAKGSTVRSLSAKDLVDFELDVPSPEMQAGSQQLLEHIDRLTSAHEKLSKALEELRSAELRLAYAEMTQ